MPKLTLHFLLFKGLVMMSSLHMQLLRCSLNMYLPYDHTSDLVEYEPSVRVSGADHLIGNCVFTGLRSEVNMVREKSVTFTTSFSPTRQLRAACKIVQDVAQLCNSALQLQSVIHTNSLQVKPHSKMLKVTIGSNLSGYPSVSPQEYFGSPTSFPSPSLRTITAAPEDISSHLHIVTCSICHKVLD